MLRRTCVFSAVTILQRGAPVADASAITKYVDVTDATWARIAFVNRRDGAAQRPLRLKIVPGGCRGFTYQFDLPKAGAAVEKFDDDIEFVNDSCVGQAEALESSDAAAAAAAAAGPPTTEKFVIDEVSMGKLKGAKIDFLSNLNGMGFVCAGNENVDASCACKMSFSMKGAD